LASRLAILPLLYTALALGKGVPAVISQVREALILLILIPYVLRNLIVGFSSSILESITI
jgi:hypothetical protein